MICFNCRIPIQSHQVPYGYASQQTGLINFFPDLTIAECRACHIPQVDHHRLTQNELDQYYAHVYRDQAKLGLNISEYEKAYFIGRGKGQARLIKKYRDDLTPQPCLHKCHPGIYSLLMSVFYEFRVS